MSNLIRSGLLIILLLFSGCGWDGTPTRPNDFTPLTSLEITAELPAIAPHSSTRLTVKGNYSGLYTRDITDQVVWSSAAPTVAAFLSTVRPNRVTGLAPGTALLTATVGNVSSTFSLTVTSASIASLTITPVDPSLAKGLSSQFALSGIFSDGSSQDLTFDAVWSSTAPEVASVSNHDSDRGLAHAIAIGTATISAMFDNVRATTQLTVTRVVLQTITITPANGSLLSLSTSSLTATGNYSDGSTVDLTGTVVWSSSRSDIASVGGAGTVKALLQGTTTITAALEGVSGTSNLNVTGGNLTAITITPATPQLVRDTVARITATGTFSNGSIRDITGSVDWSVAVPAVATVIPAGGNLAWLSAAGVTTTGTRITARSGSLSGEALLMVSAPQLVSIAVTPTLDLTVGTSSRLITTARYNDGTSQDVTANTTWASTAVNTASVGNSGSAKGRVTGVAAGSATINAAYGGFTSSAAVTVKNRNLTGLTINGSSAAVSGNQARFTATASYGDGFSKDVTEDAVWSLDKANVAILADSQNQPGQVVPVATGSADLSATFGGLTRTATITVP
jgi:hypothetical protein